MYKLIYVYLIIRYLLFYIFLLYILIRFNPIELRKCIIAGMIARTNHRANMRKLKA